MRDFKDFTDKECMQIWNSVLKNNKHTDEVKTAHFISKLKNIDESEIEDIMDNAEEYFYYTSQFFKAGDEDKMLFAARIIKEIKTSELECCLQLFNPDSVKEMLIHSLSLEHFLIKNNINLSLHKDIDYIVDYFKATKNVNKKELTLLYKLVKENTYFLKILKRY